LQTSIKAVTTIPELSSKRFSVDSTSILTLTAHQPNKLTYKSTNANDGLAVFSEMYYANGWIATINGKETPIQRVNYTLRGLQIPAGNHDIVFKFEPQVVQTGSMIALGSSVLFGLLLIGGVWFGFRKKEH
jgi:LPXTG-motif cell wall-anchored protein